jgi:hypothetical protein
MSGKRVPRQRLRFSGCLRCDRIDQSPQPIEQRLHRGKLGPLIGDKTQPSSRTMGAEQSAGTWCARNGRDYL